MEGANNLSLSTEIAQVFRVFLVLFCFVLGGFGSITKLQHPPFSVALELEKNLKHGMN